MRTTAEDRDTLPAVMAPRQMPEARTLLADLRSSVVGANWFQQKMRQNEDLRVCYWAGQTPDGRKHGTQDEPARPWENSADHRVHLIQEIMNERTSVRKRAIKGAKISIKGRTLDDNKNAALLMQVVDYYLKTEMGHEVDDETEYLSNWSQDYGHSILYTGWITERQLEERTIKLSDLQQAWAIQAVAAKQAEMLMSGEADRSVRAPLGAENAEGAPQAGGTMTPEMEAEVTQAAMQEALVMLESPAGRLKLVELLQFIDEDLAAMGKQGGSEALRAINRLRRAQEATYLAPFVKRSCPQWEALQPMVDVFYPTETRQLSRARWIARVRWMTKVDLLSWAEQEGMEEDWVRQVLMHPGKCLDLSGLAEWVLSASGTRTTTRMQGDWMAESERHYQVVEVYWRAFTAFGVPVLYRTIAHGQVQNGFGKHEVCQAYHGEYPFHDLREEKWDKLLLNSRGVPELIGTAQHAVKSQWDSRTNAASITTCPPLVGPPGSTPPAMGPGVYVEQPRAGDLNWMTPPQPDSRSIDIERAVLERVDRMYGRFSQQVPEALQVLIQGTLADNMLSMMRRALQMTIQLIQQYTPDLQGRRITGTDDYVTATRDDIQGMFDIEISWDANDLSLEWVEKKLKFYTSMLIPIDNRNIIDRAEMIKAAAESVDPLAAKRFIRDGSAADRIETDEETAALSTIFSGGIPAFVVGANHELRAQIMREDLQGSPVRQQMMQANPDIAKVWENRLQKHLMQVQQEANKQAGIEGGSDPLQQSPLAQLKAGGWMAAIGMQGPQAAVGGGLP